MVYQHGRLLPLILTKFFHNSFPPTDLFKGSAIFVWSDACQIAFDRAKALIWNVPVLTAPQWEKRFSLEVDARLVGAWAVLLQNDQQGEKSPLRFFQRKLIVTGLIIL